MRTVHYRLYGVQADRIEDLSPLVAQLASARRWRGDRFWMATPLSRALFDSEYFRHARDDEGESLAGAGFINLSRDETDALATLYFLAELSREFNCRAAYRDSGHALAKMRSLEFRGGLLMTGLDVDELVGTRPIIKRVGEVAVTFYPPRYRSTSFGATLPNRGWGYTVHEMRATAPTFLEAEREAMKLVTGFGRLQ